MGSASAARSSAKTCTTCLARTGEKLARSAARANGAICFGGSRARNICVSQPVHTYLEGGRKRVGERCLGLARCVELQALGRLAGLQRFLDPCTEARRREKSNALYALVWPHECVQVAARLRAVHDPADQQPRVALERREREKERPKRALVQFGPLCTQRGTVMHEADEEHLGHTLRILLDHSRRCTRRHGSWHS